MQIFLYRIYERHVRDEFIITKIHDGKYSGHEKGNVVMLSVDMLEPIPEEEIDGTEIDDFLSAMRVN